MKLKAGGKGGSILADENMPVEDLKEEDETKPLDPLELTQRDIAIFKFAHEHRYIAYSQIREGFWKDRTVSAKTCYKRIERLMRSGFLKKGYSGRKKLDTYFATEKSLEILRNSGCDSGIGLYKPTEHFDRNIDHDLKVLNLRIFFRDLGLDSWTSERICKERNHLMKIPDGIINVCNYQIAIEFENRNLDKAKIRYQEMLNYYNRHNSFWLLFVIVDGDVKDWLMDMNYDIQQVWFVTYRELMKKKRDSVLENKAGHFILNEIL